MVEEKDIKSIMEGFESKGIEGSQAFSYSLIVSGQEEDSNMSPNLYQLTGSNIAICVDPDLADINHAETVARATYGKIPEYQKHKSSTFAGKVTTSRPEVTMASGEEDRIADLSRWNPLDKKYEQDGNGDINQIAANLLYQHNVKGIRKYNELLVTAKKDLPSPVSGIVITDNNTFDDSEFNPDIIKGLLESNPNLKLYLYSPNTANSMVECDREIAIVALSNVKDIKEADGTITFDQFKAKYAEVEKSRSATKDARVTYNPPSSSTSNRAKVSQLMPKESQELNDNSII